MNEDSGAHPLELSGIDTGATNEADTLVVSATSSDTDILPDPIVVYDSDLDIWTLTFTPAADMNTTAGTVSVTVTVDDGQASNHATSRTFSVQINPVNDQPSFVTGGPVTIFEDSGAYSHAWASDLSTGPADESGQLLTFSTSDYDPTLFAEGGEPAIAADGTLTFTSKANAFGVTNVTVTLSDNGGTALGGDDTADTQTFELTITPVNDTPILTVPGTQSTNEDEALGFSGASLISVSDNSGENPILVSLNAAHGTLSLSGISGLDFSIGDGSADSSMTFTGKLADVNTALNGLSYLPGTNYNGSDSLAIHVDDQGYTGGSSLIANATISLNVIPVNDAPVNTLPGTQSIDEDTTLYLSGGLRISVSDVDAGSSAIDVTLSANRGLITLGSTDGVSLNGGDGALDGTVTLHGSISSINAALNNTRFFPDQNAVGAASLTITTNDLGNTGGDPQTKTNTLTINLQPVNDAPEFTSPGAQATAEDTTVTFSGTNKFIVADVDDGDDDTAGNETLHLTLSVLHGTLGLSSSTGLTFSGDGTSALALTGSITNLNAALDGVVYHPNAHFNGNDTLSYALDDLGYTGSGTPAYPSGSLTIQVAAVNNAPSIHLPASQQTNEDVPLVLSGADTISVNDVDDSDDAISGNETLQVTLSANDGTLSLASTTGLTFDEENPLIFTGSITNLNAALDGLTFTPDENFNGAVSLDVSVSDLGYTGGEGDPIVTSDSLAISVNAVNDDPLVSLPVSAVTDEDTALKLAGIAVSDVDAGADDLNFRLAVGNGTLTFLDAIGLTFINGSANGDPVLEFTASQGAFAAALLDGETTGLVYAPTHDSFAGDTFSLTVNDLGHNPAGNSHDISDNFPITVDPVNDAPHLGDIADQILYEDFTPFDLALSGIDTGAANEADTLEVSATSGDTDLLPNPSVVYDSDNGTWSLHFTSAQNQNTPADPITVTVTVDDGQSENNSITRTFTVEIVPVNDEPSFTPGDDVPVSENSGAYSAVWATDLSTGPTDESSQQLTFDVSNDNNGLFAVQPTIAIDPESGNGVLSFTTQLNAYGDALVTVTLADNGGIAYGGDDTTGVQTFHITISAVNDAPALSVPGAASTNEDEDTTITGFDLGDVDAASLQVSLSVSHGTISLADPEGISINSGADASAAMTFSGTADGLKAALNGLTYSPEADYNGADALNVLVSDLGATGTGNVLTAEETVDITVVSVNDAPTLDAIDPITINEDTFSQTVTLTGIGTGAANEADTLTFSASSDKTWLIPDPIVSNYSDSTATLFYTTVPNAFSQPEDPATITVTVDDGQETNHLATQTFTITVNPVNDPPAFTKGENVSVSEDSGANTFSHWATGITVGQANESDQTLTFHLTNDNTALFSVQPDVDPESGDLTFTPKPDAFGFAHMSLWLTDDGGTANGGANATQPQDFVITVTPVNDAPSFSKGADQTVNEDSGAQSVTGWATLISSGPANESGQTVSFSVSSNHPEYFSAGPAVSSNGTLTYTPAANAFGVATVTISISDNGGSENGGVDHSASQTFSITLTALNDAPVNHLPSAQTTLEDTALVFSSAGGNAISVSDNSGSNPIDVTLTAAHGTLTLGDMTGLTVNGNGSASVAITGPLALINANALEGLTFLPDADFNGTGASLTILTDDQGYTGGGAGLTDQDSLAISVTAVNDKPFFTKGADQTVNEDSGLKTASNWATGISAGGGNDETAQELTFTLSADHPELFSSGPALSADGTLSFTPASNANGVASVTITLKDDGGTANSGEDSAASQTFTITINAINDPPTFTNSGDVTVDEDQDGSGENTIDWASGMSAGPADKSGQPLSFVFSANSNPGLFADGPSIDAASGQLTFTTVLNANGSSDLSVRLYDGQDYSATVDFSITVTAVNDAPVNNMPATFDNVQEDTSAALSGLSVSDVDAGASDLLSFDLSVVHGTLTMGATDGLAFDQTFANGTAHLLFTATLSDFNAAVATLSYQANQDYNGPETLSLVSNDQGFSGAGGSLSDSDTVDFNVAAINDAPTFANAGDVDTVEDLNGDGAYSQAWATDLSAGPADEEGQTLSFDVVVNTNAGLFSTPPAIDSSTGRLTFTTQANANGSASVTARLYDGQAYSDLVNFNIDVAAVDDAPVLSLPTDQATDEDTSISFSADNANAIAVSDVDEGEQAGDEILHVSLTATNGLISLGSTDNLTFDEDAGDGTDDASMAFSGTIPEVNAALDGLAFSPDDNFNGDGASIGFLVDDLGYNGSGEDHLASASLPIAVSAVNDPPTFTAPSTVTVDEDSHAYEAGQQWTSVIDLGPADESSQTATFSISDVSNSDLFADDSLSIDAGGKLYFTLNPDANGSSSMTVTLSDGLNDSDTFTLTIHVNAVNDAPDFTKGEDQTVLEDSGAASIAGWATDLYKGPADESGQSLTFTVDNDNNGLFSLQPAVAADGTLTFTPAADANGTATVTVFVSDDGGTAHSGVNFSASQTFTINVTAVNDVPSFSKGSDQTTTEDSGANTVPGWAAAISAGPSDESSQALNFTVDNDNHDLFAVQPALNAANGTLTYTPADNANGIATVTLSLSDNGDAANGGGDTSASQSFTITVTPVNDAPSFSKGVNQTVLEDAGATTVTGWATDINKGPADESGQSLNFILSNDNNSLFDVQPAVDATSGDLTFTPKANANGSAIVTITLQDSGGTANLGDADTSGEFTFTINVTPVNDAPDFGVGADQTPDEDSGLTTVTGWATAISAGPTDEIGQTLTFSVSNNNEDLFSIQPAIASDGTLTYTLAPDANGTATVSVYLQDNGGTANEGQDTSATKTFTISIVAANDAPVNDVPATFNDVQEDISASLPNVSVSDVDANGGELAFQLSVLHGDLTIDDASGLSFIDPSVNGSSDLHFTATLSDFNTAMAGLSYQSDLNYNGPETLTLVSDDQGNTGGDALISSDTVDFTVAAVNDAPVLSLPTGQVTDEDTSISFSADNANAIAISDVDEGEQAGVDETLHVSLTATDGLISLGGTTGLTFDEDAGDGTDDASMAFSGTIAAVNTALDGLTFSPDDNFNGDGASIRLQVSDLGYNGAAGALDSDQTLDIAVTAVNDQPTFTNAGTVDTTEDLNGTGAYDDVWATNLSAGPADEEGQTLTFDVAVNTNSGLFSHPAGHQFLDRTANLRNQADANGSDLHHRPAVRWPGLLRTW